MTTKLVATDLDGTLVRTDGTVSPRTHDVLRRLAATGMPIVGVTGRGPRLIDLCRLDIPSASFLALAQGGHVIDTGSGAWLSEITVDGTVFAKAVDLIEAEAGELHCTVEADTAPESPLWGDPGPSWPYPGTWKPMARQAALSGPILKVFLRAQGLSPDELLAVARRVVPVTLCEVTEAGTGFIELTPPGVTKAAGLAVIASALGVKPSEVLAFGDAPNDGPLLAWAGRAVAVANAHPEVMALADDVTHSNDADGVASYLEQRFL
ncbi:HAD family hydrolase [Longispora albida]|uniref:HAD family hydrolase n=1 Tax=Longispora albida TaxID=203523 RepID=UPI0003801FA0|nr:HAD family hydrolase [Longispora albida]